MFFKLFCAVHNNITVFKWQKTFQFNFRYLFWHPDFGLHAGEWSLGLMSFGWNSIFLMHLVDRPTFLQPNDLVIGHLASSESEYVENAWQIWSELISKPSQVCSHTASALNAGAERMTYDMVMTQFCYLSKAAKRLAILQISEPLHKKSNLFFLRTS